MGHLATELMDAGVRIGVEVEGLGVEEADRVRRASASIHSTRQGVLSVDFLRESISVHDPGAWCWLSEILDDRAVYVLFFKRDDLDGCRVSSGKSLSRLLAECVSFSCIIVDAEHRGLLILEDHDCLVAAGDLIASMRDYIASRT